MTFLLVGDNRTGNNWGGRAGCLALNGLLRRSLGPGRSVTGAEISPEATGYGFRSRLFPASKVWIAKSLARRPHPGAVVKSVCWLDRRLGAGDFLTNDPVESVQNLRDRMSSDPGLADLYARVAEADVVVINGEGDVVFSRPIRRHLRFFAAMVQLAGELGRPAVWINSILSDCARTGRDPDAFAMTRAAMQQCRLVTVRDRLSLAVAEKEMGLAGVELVPDALFDWYDHQALAMDQLPDDGDLVIAPPESDRYLGRLDFSGDYICVGGNSRVTLPGEREILVEAYRRLCGRLRDLDLPVYLVVSDGRDRFLEEVAEEFDLGVVPVGVPIHLAAAILGRSRLLISGRYHPTIMAALGGAPSIFLAAGAHKMASLAEVLDCPDEPVFPAAPTDADVDRIVDLAARHLAAGEPLRERIRAVAAIRAGEVAALDGMLIAATGERARE